MRIILWILFGVATLGVSPNTHADWNLHVAADAPADGDGTIQAPFRTLTQARDAIRAARQSGSLKMGEAVTVQLGPGVYHLQSSFQLTTQDSGAANAPVIYRAKQPRTARLRGGVSLPRADFRPVTDPQVLARIDDGARSHVLVSDVSRLFAEAFTEFKTAFRGAPPAPWLYLEGRPMPLARWPNADDANGGWAQFTKAIDTGLPEPDAADAARRKARPGSFEFKDPRPARWSLEDGVWLQGYWTHDWSDEVIRVAAYDKTAQVVTLAEPHTYGIAAGTWGAEQRRFYAFNTLDELDSPGEWYLDRTGKLLYFYPPADLSQAELVLASSTQPLLSISRAKHLRFEGLVFEYSHGGGAVLEQTEHVEIAGCEFSNLAGQGVLVNGANNTVRSCDLHHLGAAGVSLNGGDRRSLTLANNQAINNHIHHYGRFQRTYAPGIGVQGCGQIVRNNCIHDAPHNAVLYGGNEHRFELNEIYRVVMETGDSGAFYTGRDWTSQGNVLRHNYIHDLGAGDSRHVNTMGVYLDDCDSGDTVEGNIFYRAGRAIMIGGGRNNPVINNLVVDCPIGLHIDARGMTWKQWNDPNSPGWNLEAKAQALNYLQPPWSERYPQLAILMRDSPREPLHNPILRNVFVNCTQEVCSFDGNVKKLIDKLEIADNLAVATSASRGKAAPRQDIKGFTWLDIAEKSSTPNALVQADGWLRKHSPGFQPIPFNAIGLMQDEYRSELP